MSRAAVLAEIAANDAAVRVARIAEAEALALEALSVAGSGRWDVSRAALYALGWARSLARQADRRRLRPLPGSCERPLLLRLVARARGRAAARLAGRAERGAGLPPHPPRRADERGEPSSYALLRLHLCELELRAGEWAAAERRLDEWAESSDSELLVWPMYERCRALLATGRGRPTRHDAGPRRRWTRVAETGVCWDLLECRRALGTLELLGHDPARQSSSCAPVWEHTEREGVRDPGAFPVAPDLVEALVEIGRARGGAGRDGAPGRAGGRAGSSLGARYRRSLRGNPGACRDLRRAGGGGARTVGRGAREPRPRARRRAGTPEPRPRPATVQEVGCGTRDAGGAPPSAFDELGSPGWADVARSELARVGARRPAPEGGLTADGTTGGRARGPRAGEQGDRPGDGRQRQDGRVPPLEHVREARDPVARRARADTWGRRSPRTKP